MAKKKNIKFAIELLIYRILAAMVLHAGGTSVPLLCNSYLDRTERMPASIEDGLKNAMIEGCVGPFFNIKIISDMLKVFLSLFIKKKLSQFNNLNC